MADIRNEAIKKLIELNYSEKTAPHIVDSVIEVFSKHRLQDVTSTVLINGNIKLNTSLKEAFYKNKKISLTPKEFKMVEYLCRNVGMVLSHKEILKNVWGPAYTFCPEYLRVIIAHIRKKTDEDIIKTSPGHGYYMSVHIPSSI